MWPTMIKPDRSAMTRYIRPFFNTDTDRKEWILRKYVKKEWALNPFPENQESLGPYNILEMRCVKQLKIMKWMPPPSRPCHTERTEEIDQNKCIESNVPQAPVPSVSSPIRESYNDVFVKTAREIPVEHSKAIVVRAATSIFATEEYEQAAPEPISDSPSTKNTEAPSMPKRETTPLATLAPSDDQASPSIPILSKSISRRPQSPTSDFSDDLYGTGRPLRPGLINSTEKVHAWRLSSIGNPPLSISPRQPWEELPPPPHGNQRIEHPSMPTFSLLIPVDLEDLAVGSGETVTEEDNSILADLNEAFLSGGKVEEDETRYLEDDETDVDSEMEKLVFQFEGVEKVKKGEGHRDNRLLEMDESEQTEDSESHGHGTILEGEAIQGDSDTWKGLAEEITARETREQCREAEDNLSTAFSYKTSFESSTTTENVPEETIVNHCQLLPVFTKSPLSPQTQSPIDFESDPEKETDKIVPMPPGTNEDAESRSPATTDPFASVLSSVRCRNDKRFGALDSHDVDEMAKQDLKLFILKSGLFSG